MTKLIELAIDTIIKVNCVPVKVVKAEKKGTEICGMCVFNRLPGSCKRFICMADVREDKTTVYFEEVKK